MAFWLRNKNWNCFSFLLAQSTELVSQCVHSPGNPLVFSFTPHTCSHFSLCSADCIHLLSLQLHASPVPDCTLLCSCMSCPTVLLNYISMVICAKILKLCSQTSCWLLVSMSSCGPVLFDGEFYLVPKKLAKGQQLEISQLANNGTFVYNKRIKERKLN